MVEIRGNFCTFHFLDSAIDWDILKDETLETARLIFGFCTWSSGSLVSAELLAFVEECSKTGGRQTQLRELLK